MDHDEPDSEHIQSSIHPLHIAVISTFVVCVMFAAIGVAAYVLLHHS